MIMRATGVAVLALLSVGAFADETPPDDPLEIDKIERETVRLVLLDVVVLDKDDRTVAGLTTEDFEIHAGGRWVTADTLDTRCEEGGLEDPRGVRNAAKRGALAAPEQGRRVVLAFDYQHLGQTQRLDVLERARSMVRHGMVDGEEIMVAALTGGLRVEQPFSADREETLETLKRMEYDITLWNGNFAHQSERGFVRGLTSLLDVAGAESGPKAMVLFSAMTDVPLDTEFKQIAAHAAASRCAIYPVDAMGMRTRLQDLALERRAKGAMRPG